MRIRLDIPLTLSEISDCDKDAVIEYISTDTREISAGDLFIPLSGRTFNGHDFITEAMARGALVLDTNDGALDILKIARLYKTKLKGLKYTVGITGSVGKTTAKEFIYKIASLKYRSHKTFSNENNIIGVAKTILTSQKNTEALIIEVGTNHIGEIKRIADVIRFDIALITNIGTSHIGNFGTRDAIAREKLCIASDGETRLISRYEDALGGFTFSAKDPCADLHIEKQGDEVNIYKGGRLFLKCGCPFSEKHLLEEISAAASVCHLMKMSSEELNPGISSLSYDNTRQKFIKLKNFSILSDCYNASLESFKSSFDTISAMKDHEYYSAVIGDIDELSNMSESIHYELGKRLAFYNFRRIYLIGDMQEVIKDGYKSILGNADALLIFDKTKTVSDIADTIIKCCMENEIILFKASRKMRFEVIIDEIIRRCKN